MPTLINEGPEKCMSCGARYDLESDHNAAVARAERAEEESRHLRVVADARLQDAGRMMPCGHHDKFATLGMVAEPGCVVCSRDAALERVKELERSLVTAGVELAKSSEASWKDTARIAELEQKLAEKVSDHTLAELDALARVKELEEVVRAEPSLGLALVVRARIAELEGALQSAERILHAIRTNPALTHLHEWAEGASKQARAALEKK